MSAPEYDDIEVTITLAVPLPADPAYREEIYGTSDIAACIKIDFDTDAAAVLLESTIVNMEVAS